jgi:NADH-quinone oxidoreductase chain G
MITVTINSKKITLEKAVSILDAAKLAGVKIPTLCHHESLEAFGGCRLCLVEVEKMPRLQTSCSLKVTDGMVVWTETDKVVEARKAMLEFLLINHSLDCPYCDKAGECDLQDLAMKYGPSAGRFAEGKRKHPESYEDPIIVRNMERCISCTRCVRMCEKVQGASAIAMVNRTSKTFVEPFSGGRYDCEYCGNCLTVCPVGAIMSRMHKHTYRPWYIEKEVQTVCSFCGVGCSLTAQVRGDSLVRVVPEIGRGLNKGLLCNRGRFGYDYISSPRRLKVPMIRKDGELRQTTWSEALTYIAQRLKEISEKSGGQAIGGVASPRCTNEDNYIFQKFMRVALDSNNIDSVAGFAFAPAQRFFENIFGQGVTANPIHGISRSDGIFVTGGDPTSVNPILGLQVRSAASKGIAVVTVGHMPGLKSFPTKKLVPGPLAYTAVLAALVSGVMQKRSFTGEKASFEEILKKMQPVSLGAAAQCSGIPEEELRISVEALAAMTNPSIIIGRDSIQSSSGQDNMFLLAALTYLLNGRIYLLSELPNEQGLIDMGCLPDMLPGERPLGVDTFRNRYGEFFSAEIPQAPGLSLMEMIEAARAGKLKALYVMGENIAFNVPDNRFVREALAGLEFLVVQDIFLNETAEFAHVVLPSLAWAEKEGSYTNLERRMQHVRKAIDGPQNSGIMEDWRILSEISGLLGSEMKYNGVRDVLAEIAKVSPLHKGISYEDMDAGQCIWPYKGEPLRHDVSVGSIVLPDTAALLSKADGDKTYIGVEKPLFHSASQSRNSQALNSIQPGPYLRIGQGLAKTLSLAEGDYVAVSSTVGTVELPALIDAGLPDNMVLAANNFEGKGVYQVMAWKMNSATKSPALDGMEVSLKKIQRKSAEVSG